MVKRLLGYLLPYKKNIIMSSISVLLFLISQLMIPFLVGKAINSIGEIQNGVYVFNSDFFPTIMMYLSICLGLAIIGIVFDYIFEYSVSLLTQHAIKDIRNDVFSKLCTIPIKDIDADSKGNMIQYEIGDVENISTGIYSVFKQLVQGILTVIITIVLMFSVNWILAIAVIVLTPLSLVVSKFVADFIHKYFKKKAKYEAELNSISRESIVNLDTVVSLNYQDDTLKAFIAKDEEWREDAKVAIFASSWVNPSTRLVNNTIYAIIGIAGIIMIMYTEQCPILGMSIGALSSFLSYTSQYTKPFNEISSVLSEFETAKSSFARIDTFLNKEDDIDNGTEEIKEPIEEIRFDDMSFSYVPERKLIEHFSKTITKGQKVAIVGPTGAGKTTIINVLMRFYDPTDGCIRFNGISSIDMTKKNLRSNFGMVLQETWIFSGTIMENVRYAKPDATDEEVKQACRDCHAEQFIMTLPDGYDTQVSAKGGLSEGERQLLTIARVMLLKPDIVILDEATSNVDTRTEKIITDAFDKMMEGRTSIVIAHRLSTIQEADMIIVLKDGHVEETGNHDSLMQAKGLYYSLYSSQFE